MSWRPGPWTYGAVGFALGGGMLFTAVTTATGPVRCHGRPLAENEICHRVDVGTRRYRDLGYAAKKERDHRKVLWLTPLGALFVVGGGLSIGFRRRFGESLKGVDEQRERIRYGETLAEMKRRQGF
ncbi:hypothetical protein [Actinocorallia longicatena]|uniref:Transmembrane protein n=1 Tax=Actinocorallia longicatena TaxID=111803 RepID=A0ABP6QLH6_9ACTN